MQEIWVPEDEVTWLPVSPISKKPLTRVERMTVPMYRMVSYEEEVREKMKGMPEWEISRAVAAERDRRYREGIPLEREILWPTEITIPPGYMFFHNSNVGDSDFCSYYEIKDRRIHTIGGKDEFIYHLRRIAERAVPRIPRVRPEVSEIERRLARYEAEMLAIERTPEFQKYVVERVGLTWDAYLRQDPWTRWAVRQEFAKEFIK